jgi:GNAT superfamily N-acetyltransferase
MISFRPAADAERRACRMLLPESAGWTWTPQYLVAMEDSPAQLLGTLACAPTIQAAGPSWHLALRVVRTHWRQGIGSRLLGLAIERAGCAGISSLAVQVDSSPGSGVVAFLQGAGFHSVRTLTTFEGDVELDAWESSVRPVCERFEASGGIPSGVRIVSLHEAPMDQVCQMYATNLGGTVDNVEFFLRNSLARGRLAASLMLMAGDKLVGFDLMEYWESVVEIYGKVVDPEYRRGWASPMLSLELVRRLKLCARRRVRFVAFDNVSYTMKFAGRQSLPAVKVESQFVRTIERGGLTTLTTRPQVANLPY